MKNTDYSLYLVTDRDMSPHRDLENIVREAVAGGVTIVQLREKHLPTPEFIALARRLKAILAPARVPLIINDNLEVALASDTDGIHIGQHDMPYAEVRRQLGPDKIIGLSIETLEQLDEANRLDVDYVAASPVFGTPTKTDTATPWGLEGLKTFVQCSQHPVIAIGGINTKTLPSVLSCGIQGAAVVSAIIAAPDPRWAALQLKHQIILARIRAQKPLVHNITNYVAMNPAANALLAIGASPLMSFFPDEMEEIVTSADALTINIGCLDATLMLGARIAAATAQQLGKPWVLDPVGVGVSTVRTTFAQELLQYHPTIIRGNASEIATLAGAPATSRGVDATVSVDESRHFADKLAKNAHSIVVMSGAVDYITDGTRHQEIPFGSPMMSQVTALGCTATALLGAFIAPTASNQQLTAYENAVHATFHLALAGDETAKNLKPHQLGTFASQLIDHLSDVDANDDVDLSNPSNLSNLSRNAVATVLTIAGSDSGGGAGIQADIKAISATGSYAASAITAVTVQNTLGVEDVSPVPVPVISAQISAVLSDIGADAIKIGMLHSEEVVEVVAEQLIKFHCSNIVLDPVMVSTSGHRLIEESAIESLKKKLIPLARVITPNIPEAEILAGCKITSAEQFREVARKLSYGGKVSVLLKAGHLEDALLTDLFYNAEEDCFLELPGERIKTQNTHGTGCTLSSALASYLAQRLSLNAAVQAAKAYITAAITSGAMQHIGHGHGPVNHFWMLKR